MPGHDGLGLDNDNGRAPIAPTARQPDPEQAIGLARARPFDASLENRESLTKSEILKSEAPAAGEKQAEQSNERGNQLNHCCQDVRTAGLAVQ